MQNQDVKVYANTAILATEDRATIDKYNSFVTSAPIFGDSPEFKAEYFAFCNEIREAMGGINNVISFLVNDKNTALLIFTYDVFANEGKSYTHGIDEKGSYMVLMQNQPQ